MNENSRPSAIDALTLQGRYALRVTGFDAALTLREEDGEPTAKTCFILKTSPNTTSPAAFSNISSVQLSGPAESFDKTIAGKSIFGCVHVRASGCEIFIAGTPAFLTHAASLLPLLATADAQTRCTLLLTTATKIDADTSGYVPILDAQLSFAAF